MTYASLMVHMDIDQPNEARLKAAGNPARRLGPPAIIGIAACDQSPPLYFGDTAFVHKLVEEERARLTQRMAVLKDDFQQAMAGHAKAIEWRCARYNHGRHRSRTHRHWCLRSQSAARMGFRRRTETLLRPLHRCVLLSH